MAMTMAVAERVCRKEGMCFQIRSKEDQDTCSLLILEAYIIQLIAITGFDYNKRLFILKSTKS